MSEPKGKAWDRPPSNIHKAAYIWYGKSDLDSCCLAENRLARGETPKKDQ